MKRAFLFWRSNIITALLLGAVLCISGCGQGMSGADGAADSAEASAEASAEGSAKESADVSAGERKAPLPASVSENAGVTMLADSLDHALVRQVDTDRSKILLYSETAGKSYILSYDSATTIQDKYGQELVAGQLESGDMVYAAFVKDEHLAKGFWLDPDMEKKENVQRFTLHIASSTMEIADEPYSLAAGCPVLSGGELLELSDINESDTLTTVGVGKDIRALVISRGHGYVRLIGGEAFEDGFVEFGQNVIRKVEKDALYVVPEGQYKMTISKGEDEGVKDIEVKANEEIEVDVSDILTEKEKTGKIIFTITPENALLKIDDEQRDKAQPVELCYGIHKIEASAEGYRSVTQYIRVGSEMANLSIDLEEQSEQGDAAADSATATVSGNETVYSAGEEGEYRVYIDGPAQAELYVDDIYIGVVPASFAKKSGRHTISLRRDGFVNRSYTLEIDNGQNDNHYSFSSLKPSASATTDADLAQSALSSLLSGGLGVSFD